MPGPEKNISDADFSRLAQFIKDQCGIKMPPTRKQMVSSRLQARLRETGFTTFAQYIDYVTDPRRAADERVRFIDLITTNHTSFFREPHHFDLLTREILPQLTAHGAGRTRPLAAWSAACSSGQEPYTLAIVLSEFARKGHTWEQGFSILATDLSSRILEEARQAIYPLEEVSMISLEVKRRYLLKGKDAEYPRVKVAPALRDRVTFRQLNLLDPQYGAIKPQDIIFCRNVFIYFERPVQAAIARRFRELLHPGGYLFIGNHEALPAKELGFAQVDSTVYRKA